MGRADTVAHDPSVAGYGATRRFWPLRGQNAHPRIRAGRNMISSLALRAG
ncbi:hypothetical protein BH10PSE6_BH10PSE6_32730 [soil metagenome]